MELNSRSPRDGSFFFGFAFGAEDDWCPDDDLASSSLSSSSSITNCGASTGGTVPSSTSSTSSFFQNTSISKELVAPSNSNTTGRTLCKTRIQFRTSFVVFRSVVPVPALMKDVARADTEADDGAGKVWSEMRLNNREHITRIKVAIFSGASKRARRTNWRSASHLFIVIWRHWLSLGVIRENTSEAESNKTTYCKVCQYFFGRSRPEWSHLIPVAICFENILAITMLAPTRN